MAADPGAIAQRLTLEPTGFVRGIGSAITSLSKFAGGIGIAGAALGLLATQQFRKATDAAQRFEDNLVRLNKVAGPDIGAPLAKSIRELSTELPVAQQRLFEVAESAVRLGVTGTKNIKEFVTVMAEIETVTDMTAIKASESFARLAAIMDVPISQVRNLASVANELSDTMATNFTEIVNSAGQIAPVMTQMGVAPEKILAFAAAQNEVNISVRRGARSLRSFTQQLDETNRLANIAGPLGMTNDELRNMIDNSPVETLMLIVQRMKEGGDAARDLREAFDSAARIGIQSLSQNIESLEEAFDKANTQMEEGSSLTRQFQEFVESTSARQVILTNRLEDFRAEIGENLLPLRAGVVGFFSSFVRGLRNMHRALDPSQRALESMPEEAVGRLKEAFGELQRRQGGPLQGRGGGILQGGGAIDWAEAGKNTSAFAHVIENLAGQFEDAGRAAEFMRAATDEVEGALNDDDITTLEEAVKTASDLAIMFLELERRAIAAGEGAEELDPPLSDLEERLKGMDLAFAKLKLEERFDGLDFSEITDDQAKVLLDLMQTEIALTDGEEAAMRFQHRLQGFSGTVSNFIIETKRSNEALGKSREEFEDQLESLVAYGEALEEGADAVRLLRLEEEGYDADEAKRIMQQEDRNKAREDANAAVQENKDAVKALRAELAREWEQNLLNEESLLRLKMARLGVTDADREHLLLLRQMIDAQNEAEEAAESAAKRQDQMQKRLDRFDITKIETQFRFLERSIDRFSGSVVDAFESMGDSTKSFSDAFSNMTNTLIKEATRMMLNRFLFSLLSNFMGDFGGGGPELNLAPPQLPNSRPRPVNTGPASPMDGSGSSLKVENNFTIQALDSKDVTRMLNENAGRIADNTTKAIQQSAALKNRIDR